MMPATGLPAFGSPARLRFHTTSAAVTGVPSCHSAPWRSSISIFVLSAFQPHLLMRPGLKERSAAWSMYWSNTAFQMPWIDGFTAEGPVVGSQLGRPTL